MVLLGVAAMTLAPLTQAEAFSGPHCGFLPPSCTVYFNHTETKDIAAGAVGAGGVASKVPAPIGPLLTAAAALLVGEAVIANNHGQCLKAVVFLSPLPPNVPVVPLPYSGTHCD